ncbi:MAG: acetate--CoA ligase [Pseudomonadota bacterium]
MGAGQSVSETDEVFPVPKHILEHTRCTEDRYRALYEQSVADSEGFWGEQGKRLDWLGPYSRVRDVSFQQEDLHVGWFTDGVLNVCANCVDRHLPARADDVAIIWESDDPAVDTRITYRELHVEVCRFANALKACGVKRGDRVVLYLPMIPEAAYAMLACARIGAVHSVVFGGFSAEALASRIQDCGAHVVVTADEGVRGGKHVPMKATVDAAIDQVGSHEVRHVLSVRRTGAAVPWDSARDRWWHKLREEVSDSCQAEAMSAEDPLFILYTSGSTGKPKGVLHTSGGYLVYASMTHEYVFDYRPGQIYWCSADVGWITGHSYIVYGPLANGATTLMYEGVPNYPSNKRLWEVIDKHAVEIFYTAPTVIRSLMRDGEGPVKAASRSSLRILGTVGEPINPEAWRWYHDVVGDGTRPIVDTWWQTETGGVAITPLPGATALKPGSATRPFFGIQPALVDSEGKRVEGEGEGNLVLVDSWPGQMRTVYGDHQRFIDTYFKTFPGTYFTGDGARRDADGYYWITGRVDDVLNVSGHRMGTAEIESALVLQDSVAEAAVVGYPHEIKGQGIYAYVTLNAGLQGDEALRSKLVKAVRAEIGPIATIDKLQFAAGLPKTRSGKIMRRILRKIAEDEVSQLGDTSTLAEPAVVEKLVEQRIR